MNLTGLGNASIAGPNQPGHAAAVYRASDASVGSSDPTDGNTTTQISKGAQFLNQLQNLEQTNPAEARQILSQVSTQLTQKAQQTTGDQAQALLAMANKVQAAANTGDLVVLAARGSSGQGTRGQAQGRGGSSPASAYSNRLQASRMSLFDLLDNDVISVGGADKGGSTNTTA